MGAGQVELVAQEVGQKHSRLDLALVRLTIDSNRNGMTLAHELIRVHQWPADQSDWVA
jgi:hypothetical protein